MSAPVLLSLASVRVDAPTPRALRPPRLTQHQASHYVAENLSSCSEPSMWGLAETNLRLFFLIAVAVAGARRFLSWPSCSAAAEGNAPRTASL